MKAVLASISLLILSACSTVPVVGNPAGTNPNTAAGIQASCDDKDAKETFINGHSYFCDDSAHFNAQMNAIGKMLHDRGI